MKIQIRRIYDPPEKGDGFRILVDRLWPRGVKKENAGIDFWSKNTAPSNDLRKWFHENLNQFDLFKKKYLAELKAEKEAVEELLEHCRHPRVTFLTSVKTPDQSHARILKEYLEGV